MKEQNKETPSTLYVILLSWFYVGKIPKAPGTFGSLATIPLIYLLHYLQFHTFSLIGLILILWAAAVYFTEKLQKEFHLHDPQWIVIDEVIGMLITYTFVQSVEFPELFLIFSTFRFFDIIKIWPASFFDRLHHGVGTITDDVVSGVYAGIFSLLIRNFF